MTNEEREQLSVFEARVRHLMFLHDELKLPQTELQPLHERYSNLKQALTISLDGADVKETRQELSKLVREIDKCITMLVND